MIRSTVFTRAGRTGFRLPWSHALGVSCTASNARPWRGQHSTSPPCQPFCRDVGISSQTETSPSPTYTGIKGVVVHAEKGFRGVLQNAKGPVLDVGCGSGYKTVRLEGYIPEGVELHGVDTNPLYGTMWESLDTRAKFHLVKVGEKRMFTPGSEHLSPEIAPPRPPFPLCMEVCPGAEAELKEHGAEMWKLLDSRLHEVGAVLFQGLPLSGTKDFDELIGSLGWELFGEYKGGTAIRNISSEASMEASAEPFNFTIEPHQELSYSSAFPAKFALYCEREASLNSGCETVITDFRQVTDKLDKAFFHGAKAMGFKYALRMSCERTNPAAHYPFFWQRQIYDSKEATEMWLNRKGYTWSWEADGTLVMEIVLPSVRTHPITGEDIFFAQPHCFSASYSVAHPILMLDFVNEWSRAPDDLPFRISYGDGSAVSDETINHVRKTIYDCSVAFAMRSGDLLMLDNMLAGHGRMSGKTGSGRKMMSAMLQPMGSE
ncbi:unnamed protein product [Prorocentrum cordatum]|uniref:TauD/TfdA-like domain-containing protein n=1 Tax=Prorocentrum cordatum TaxID=2364126 RepID=A0ABN9Y1G6_9DINO|nr:unnamed protein product [Polarella glacialis]